MINKNRERKEYTFANINLLGKCNCNCYFCLGKDIDDLLTKHNQLKIPFNRWKNFIKFLKLCKQIGIEKLYITGQNTDSLLYYYLEELIDYLQGIGFSVGLRTNGYLALEKIDIINKCKDEIGYSVQSLVPLNNYKILGRKDIPNWDEIIPTTKNPRISIVINRYNICEFENILKYLAQFKNIRYIQARRISTDTRLDLLASDIQIYESLYNYIENKYASTKINDFYLAQRFIINGKEVCFWRTVETNINSLNYFTDGTISENYFVVEGYLKNYKY